MRHVELPFVDEHELGGDAEDDNENWQGRDQEAWQEAQAAQLRCQEKEQRAVRQRTSDRRGEIDGEARQLSQADKAEQQLRSLEAHQIGRYNHRWPCEGISATGRTQLDQSSRPSTSKR
jgi:hypothetical protein